MMENCTRSTTQCFMRCVRYIFLHNKHTSTREQSLHIHTHGCTNWMPGHQTTSCATFPILILHPSPLSLHTGSLLQGLNANSAEVQAAISEKAAHFIQHTTTFSAGNFCKESQTNLTAKSGPKKLGLIRAGVIRSQPKVCCCVTLGNEGW